MKKVPSFQDLLYNPAVPPRKNGRIANTVVYHYVKNHENPGVRQLASKLQKEVPILQNEKVPSFQDLLYNFWSDKFDEIFLVII